MERLIVPRRLPQADTRPHSRVLIYPPCLLSLFPRTSLASELTSGVPPLPQVVCVIGITATKSTGRGQLGARSFHLIAVGPRASYSKLQLLL